MTLNLDISAEEEAALHQALGDDLSRAAKEALVIEAYRQGKLYLSEVRDFLGFAIRDEVLHFFAQRGVYQNYSLEDLEQDRKVLDEVLKAKL